jgi:hypothetical protein
MIVAQGLADQKFEDVARAAGCPIQEEWRRNRKRTSRLLAVRGAVGRAIISFGSRVQGSRLDLRTPVAVR